MYIGHLLNWLYYGHGLLIFLLLALFWLSETGQIWGFRAFQIQIQICLLSIHRDTTCIQLSTLCLIYTTAQSLSNGMEWKWGMSSGSQSRNHRPGPAVMVPALRPWDHTTQPRIGRPKMKPRTTEPQMSRSGPTQSRSTRIAVPAPAARTTRPRCPIFPQAPRGMLHQRLTYDSNLA